MASAEPQTAYTILLPDLSSNWSLFSLVPQMALLGTHELLWILLDGTHLYEILIKVKQKWSLNWKNKQGSIIEDDH